MSIAVIWVSDLEQSIDFYQSLLKGRVADRSDEFANVSNDHNEVLLHLLPAEYRDEPSYGENNPIKPVFIVDGPRGDKPVQTYGDWNYQDLADPDGHIIQLRFRLN